MDQPASCKVCETGWLDAAGTRIGICVDCRAALGVVELPPARRLARPCEKCNGMTFVRVIPREYTYFTVKSAVSGHAAPMTLTRETGATKRWVFAGSTLPSSPSVEGGRGLLESYVCKGCGFVEWYCNDPDSIPIGPEFMSEDIDYEHDEPYR